MLDNLEQHAVSLIKDATQVISDELPEDAEFILLTRFYMILVFP